MDPKRIPYYLPKPSQLPPPPPPPPPPPQHSSSATSFPILALSILGILTTSILLLSYYIFVIKCCLNWRHSDVITRLSRSRIHRRRSSRSSPRDYPPAAYSAAAESRGLDESAIRSLPTFRYRKAGDSTSAAANDCAVCLNEFQEEERIRLLPNCLHLFHIDCIDTWLQSNANCPLCRSPITAAHPALAAAAQLTEPANGRRHPDRRDDDAAAIEVVISSSESRERRSHPGAAAAAAAAELGGLKRGKRPHNGGSSMGDECIEARSKDESFCIQPMRRSFSMDSSSDKQLYLALQGILQKNPHFQDICGSGSSGAGESSSSSSGSGRARRPFFSFGNHRSSRRAVLPI